MAKLAIEHIKGNTYMISSPANIGIYIQGDDAVLIDSGNDKESGRQILKLLGERGWKLKLIVNTHSNADHIGGNAFLQERTECEIAATALEASFITNPVLEPAFLFGGFPDDDMRNKFLMAKPSRVTHIIESEGTIPGTPLETLSLKGHYMDMIGIITPDGVAFLADSLFSDVILSKYHLTYLYDVKSQLETLNRLRSLKADIYVPSHAPACEDISLLIDANESKIREIAQVILSLCSEPATLDDILSGLCNRYGIELNATQYLLLSNTAKSYLSYLKTQGYAVYEFKEGRMIWQKST
ncbi:metal-dependent hydrolase, beta-lactamase superfamily (plasmid) [Peptoclostridium acidaminophilum DSM 3953]|uniref:Metal-dependent hydrolase, beta-lactamase superfamily n=1 Tax=Peptoclostridium acidaminophilum DSM 3953 TaxID=1286171 RepID=W8TPA7_PEPAC|nr:MBL fold metallo-hydrolase [Peptoclostridium acidaminophilum]AHM57977.1 metal-dependent hydrolase, beta-lactamase superfamily [Peptoclostridium acidaminophilum DSM 3953]